MTGSDRECDVETLAALLYEHREDALTCYDHPESYCCVCGEHEVGGYRGHLAAALEALGVPDDSVVVALDDFKTLRAEAKAYAAMVGKVRTLADEWEGYGHGRYNIHLEERLPCSACDLLAGLRALLAEHDKAIADEAAAEAHRCQVGGDGWSAARGRGSVGGDQ